MLLCLVSTTFFSVTSLGLPNLKDKSVSESTYVLPAEIKSMPGLDTKLLAKDLSEMGMEPSSKLMSLAAAQTEELANTKRSKPMMWVHIHKAAGSFMCAAAHLNGESVVQPGGNCNWNPDGGQGAYYTQKGHADCKRRNAHFSKNNYTWGQIERVMDNEFCFDTMDYAIWLRDPVKLALSETNYKYSAGDVESNLKCSAEGDHKKCPDPKDDVPLWKYFDNYAVRVLGGPTVYNKQPGHVTEDDAKAAIKLLKRFKIVAQMEKVTGTDQGKQHFLEEVGWSKWPAADDKSNGQGLRMNKQKNRITFSAQETEKIRNQNKYDYMLYNSVSSSA